MQLSAYTTRLKQNFYVIAALRKWLLKELFSAGKDFCTKLTFV